MIEIQKLSIPILIFTLCLISGKAEAGRLIKGVMGEGTSAIVGITPEQGRHIAIQRARADAIEKACGIYLLGSTLVRNGRLVGEFLKSFTRGFIIKENIEWQPLDELRPSENEPPIPLYRVRIRADIMIPDKPTTPSLYLSARLNKESFLSGDHAKLFISTTRSSRIAIFNIRADDRIVMLYPSIKQDTYTEPDREFIFPPKGSGIILEIHTFKGHRRDCEAFMVVAIDASALKGFHFVDHFKHNFPYSVPEFFSRYSKIAEYAVETILPYEVINPTP